MTLWATRDASIAALQNTLRGEASVLTEALAIVDEAVGRLESLNPATPFTRATAIVLAKSRNLAVGCYSLALDGLVQEAGAIFRPLIEAVELLTYLRLDPERAKQAANGSLPRAGEIAKAIEGKFHKMRDYLNTHASHFSFSWESLRHLIDIQDGSLRKVQVFREQTLRMNLAVLTSILVLLGIEGNNCLQVNEMGSADDLADRIEGCRKEALDVFKGVVPEPPEPSPGAAV